MKNFAQAINLYETASSHYNIATAHDSLAYVYLLRGDDNKAQDLYAKSELVYKGLNNDKGIAGAQYSFGILYRVQGKFELALEQYQVALHYYKGNQDVLQIAALTGEIGKTKILMGNIEEGRLLIEQANAIVERLGVVYILAEGHVDYAHALFRSQSSAHALKYLNEHWPIIQEHAEAHIKAEARVLRAKVYLALENMANAKTDLQGALKFYHDQEVHTTLAKEAEELFASLGAS